MLMTLSGSGDKSHRLDFLGDFRSCLLPETVRDNTLQTWNLIYLYRSSSTKITSCVLRASLSNSLKDYWHLCIKKTCINDTIVRADCKYIGLCSGWNKRKLSLGEVRVKYLKINFGLGPNTPRAGPGRVIF
jgi:hypothetical protein